MLKKRILTHIVYLFFVTALVGTAVVWAAALVQVSGASPFGAIGDCGNFPGTGILFLDSEVEPWLDVNPINPDNIVAIWQQDRWSDGGSRGNVAGVSFDGGETWAIVPVPGLTDCSDGEFERATDPWVSFGPDGTLHQISLVFDNNPPPEGPGGFGRNGLAVSKSIDGGLTWTDPIMIIDDDDPRFFNELESITADPTDENYVYAVWDRVQLPNGIVVRPDQAKIFGFRVPAMFARSTDGGDNWEVPRVLYDPGANNQTRGNQIVVLPDGTLIDFFSEILNFRNDDGGSQFDSNLSLKYSSDKGETWLPNGQRAIRANKIQAIGTVTPDEEIPVRDGATLLLFDVAVDPENGNLYAVWQDARFNGFDEVAFSMSTDGGFTWSTPIKINQTPANGNELRRQAFLPSVAVADGTVGVTYYDFRNDDDTGELADHWFTSCAATCSDPSKWGNEARLTDASFDYLQAPYSGGLFLGDYVGLASDGSDFLAFFPQSSAADPANGFFRRVTP